MLFEEFKDKKVFITGHTGFKGSWMLRWLSILGAEVKGFALAPLKKENLFDQIDGTNLCHSEFADIRDFTKLKKSILDFQPDFIFHLAAQPLVRLSYKEPFETFDINLNGSLNLLECVRLLEKKCVVVMITTDKVYENNELNIPFKESDKLGGFDPYSASKATMEIAISSYRNSFFNTKLYSDHNKSISVARAGNVIGGGDWSDDRIIPDIIKSLTKSEKIILRNPNATRPWQHVLEPIGGYLLLALKQFKDPITYSDSFNFGPNTNDCLTVDEMTKLCIKHWGLFNYPIFHQKAHLHEANNLSLDISKANLLLNWYPKFNSELSICKTINWYKKYINEKIIDIDTDIIEYQKKYLV